MRKKLKLPTAGEFYHKKKTMCVNKKKTNFLGLNALHEFSLLDIDTRDITRVMILNN